MIRTKSEQRPVASDVFFVSEYKGINKLSWGFIVALKRHYPMLSIVRRALSHRPTIAWSSSKDQRRQGDKPFSVQLQISSVHCLRIELTLWIQLQDVVD